MLNWLKSKLFWLASSREVKTLVNTLKIVQGVIDYSQKGTDDNKTQALVKKINSDVDPNRFGNFTAQFKKDKYNPGDSGIDIGIKTKIFGKQVTGSYDPKDGSAEVNFGIFKVKI